ncbi:hypothetical protein GCM10010307_08010 [Streptomyces vastus]|uniref:Uncharacterized protein n=1 Tax=Streptomyces vastus TaxID=285451 RepID=A0ABN3QCR9_9ACTN
MVEARADRREKQARVAVCHQRNGTVGRELPEVVADGVDDAGPEGRSAGAYVQQGRHPYLISGRSQVFGHWVPGRGAYGRAVHENEDRLHVTILSLMPS